MGNSEANGGKVLMVKNWQVILTLIAWLVLSVAQFVTVRTQADETARRVKDLEEQTVKDGQFKEFREDIIRRLDRIEGKVDAEHKH